MVNTMAAQENNNEECAHVVGGTATQQSSGDWLVSASVSSTETGWDKYANEWKAESGVDGTLLGTRVLGHPHVDEQPFTRSLSGVAIPEDVPMIILSAQDSVLGYCGDSFELVLPGRESMAETLASAETTAPPIEGILLNDTGMFILNETVHLMNTTIDLNVVDEEEEEDSTKFEPLAEDLISTENALETEPASSSLPLWSKSFEMMVIAVFSAGFVFVV